LPFLFDAHVGGCPCIDQIAHKRDVFVGDYGATSRFAKDNYIFIIQILPWNIHLMSSRSSIIYWLHSQHSASKVESKFLGPQHFKCWILRIWYYGFYFLGYKFKCPWAKDAGVLGHFQWACGCCKDILFRFLVSTHLEIVLIWVCVYLNNKYILNTFEFSFFLFISILFCLNFFWFYNFVFS
jgi:hypothetical protein